MNRERLLQKFQTLLLVGLAMPMVFLEIRAFSETLETTDPATPDSSSVRADEPDEDLRTLVLREQEGVNGGNRDAAKSAVTVRGRSDGTVEVRDASGNLIREYPLSHFYVSGKVNTEAIERIKAREEAMNKGLSDRKEAEQAALDQKAEAAKEAEAQAKEAEKAKETKWQEDFKAKSSPYLDRKTNTTLNAVKIDARDIREDGTYLYEGKPMKPIRLFNAQRSRYEMAIPVPEPEPSKAP